MNALIDAAFSRARVVIIGFVMILIFGVVGYISIPKESMPEVVIPTVYVSTSLEGISPEDSVTSLLKPLETELSAIGGLREMQTNGYEGGGSITLEFDAGFDADQALVDVRQAVDRARPNLPEDASDPLVREINTALFPIMTVVLSGPVPERALNAIADALQGEIEGLPGVLEVDIGGKREDLVEILIDPVAFETYDLSFADIAMRVSQNNVLVAGGALDSGDGRLVIKLPGLITSAQDVLDLPLKVVDGNVVAFRDVAEVRRTFMDPQSYARIDGEAAISLEIKKKSGANIIETAAGVRAVLDAAQQEWPGEVRTTITQDESEQVVTLLGDLQNNVVAAIVLVIIVILAFLGPKSAFLVGLSIPGAFLSGVALLWFSGFTMNIVVLFGLILVAGMLVDGSIVVIEYADRRMSEGAAPRTAYAEAAKRMSWPIIASTATSLSVFLPLLFWQGTVGEFMKFLPITVLMTLSASLLMALVFIPVLGAVISRRTPSSAAVPAVVDEDPRTTRGAKRMYILALERALLRPWTTILLLFMGLVLVVMSYGRLGAGVEFFPATEPDFAQVQVLSRDNLSISGQDRLLREVEGRLIGHPEIKSIYARSASGGLGASNEQIGTIQMEFTDWQTRRPADTILSELRADLETIPGLRIAIAVQAGGPAGGKPIALEIAGPNPVARSSAIDALRAEMGRIGGITDVADTRPLPGIDYEIRVDRNEAARYGADIALIGQAVRLLTTGVTVSDYRPGDTTDSVDIRIRFPAEYRTLDRVRDLRIPTDQGMIPISTFVEMAPVGRSGAILRIDGETVDQINADVAPGILPNDKISEIAAFLAATDFEGAEVRMKGEAADQAEAAQFLISAFLAAIMLMLMILVTQFNSISQALLVLSAIVFSVAGVFIGLMVTGRPFGVVMGGLGIIALAGIVVNNNIVLIDAYNEKRKARRMPIEAALMAGSERMRPVLLTSLTTVLGLIPMALAMGIDIPGRQIVMGAPSTLWWVDLSTSIVGGLSFATLLTLIVTPAALVLIDRSDRLRELGIVRRGIGETLRGMFRRGRRTAVHDAEA
jgi:multidrug efflux pump